MKIINSRQSLDAYIEHVENQFDKHKYLRMDMKTGKQRSDKQRKSLEVFCRLVAEELKSEGVTFTMFFNPGFEVPWTQEIVKDNVWRPMQKAITKKVSTTKPTRAEYIEIYDYINEKLSDFGIHVPWPCKESMKGEK